MKKNFSQFAAALVLLILFLALLPLSLPKKARAASASFYLSPSSGSFQVGDTISASVIISCDSPINAGEGSATFSSDILQYQSVSAGGSIFSFWTSGPSGGSTSVSFGGGLPHPGYVGGGGTVVTITWRAVAAGTGSVSINGSRILADDGIGTNILAGSGGGSFSVSEAVGPSPNVPVEPSRPSNTPLVMYVKSNSHPDQNSWYNNKNVDLSWSAVSADSYFIAFDQSAGTVPNSSTGATNKSFPNTGDGIWYFHARAQGPSGTGPIAHFRVQIDTVPPEAFTITVNQEGGATNATPKVTFEAKDPTSGIDKYEGIIDNGQPFAITSGGTLPKQHPGNHTLIIKAYDKAGNARESKATYKIEGITAPMIMDFNKIVGLLDPIEFTGLSKTDDVIVVFINGKEVDRFNARDNKTTYKANFFSNLIFSADEQGEQTYWKYRYTKPLFPGTYAFQFMRVNKAEAESELTPAQNVRVEYSTIKLGRYIIPTSYMVGVLLLVILGLSAFVIYLLRKMKHLAARGYSAVGSITGRVKNLFLRTERDIDKEIDEAITDSGVSKSGAEIARKDLKEKIHETIEEEEKKIGKK